MCPLRCIVSGLHIGFTHTPETQAPSAAHLVVQLPQWFWSFCVSKQPSEQAIPVMHMQVPLLQVWPLGQVTPAHGLAVVPPPDIAPPAPPTELPADEPPVVEPPPTGDTLMPPLDIGAPPVAAPPVATCAVPPLELPLVLLMLLVPALVVPGSVGVPELQAARHSSQIGVCFQE